ncbi:adenosylcobalamin-dependent ribonucleoside-diphosphate reductase [candidate division WWE3 bacterium]|nr:adenosylcobalamin-dependent ribonucleoside-diphosphate reductase [candidate division WWE3 bacterium]
MSYLDEFDKLVKEIVNEDALELNNTFSELPARISEIELSENAREIFNRRYRRRDREGNYMESIEEAFQRVASHVAAGEDSPEAKNYYSTIFYNILASLDFIPNSPTWTGAGTPLGQLAACFVLPIADDMGNDPDGIFSTLRNAALVQKTGGGNGFSFSSLRPKGDVVKTSMGQATGPVGFLEVYDGAFGEIAQGGVRRGANMAVLRVDHPDIREFIQCKAQEGKIQNFNISVAITDEFMTAVKNDTEFSLRNPRNGEVWENVRARELFDMIVEFAHRNGEPGVLFIDEANRYNPVPNQYSLEATNPCGEQWLGPYENCCLGHVNLSNHFHDGNLDWDRLAQTVEWSTRFLDDVVTVNAYVDAVPQLKEAAYKNRRIGLGYTGLADLMYKMDIAYGSDEGAEFAAQITEFVRYHSMLASISLAKERGAFPGISGSIYDFGSMTWKSPVPFRAYSRDWMRPEVDWTFVVDGIREFGIRNSTQMTVAPTGTVSTIAGLEGYGCEPVFALAYYRNVYQAAGQDQRLTLKYISPLINQRLDQLDLTPEQKDRIIDEIIERGSVSGVDELPKNIRGVFKVSADITPEEHVLMQASIQAFIDNSISKTCNFPESATKEDVYKAYFQAWESKCKGLTVYRTGSRMEVVLETKETKDKKQQAETHPVGFVVRPRPSVLMGETRKLNTPLGNMYMTVNRNDDGDYHEIFINLGKAGSDIRADAEAMGRLISLIFRLGSANNQQRMAAVIEELEGISSGMSSGFGEARILSIPDAIALALKQIDNPANSATQTEMPLFPVADNEPQKTSSPKQNKEMCPFCGNYSVIMVEGCKKCSVQLGGCGGFSAC